MAAAMRYRRPEHSEIKHKNMRFLITDRPTDPTVEKYIEVSCFFYLNLSFIIIFFPMKYIKHSGLFN